MIGERAPRVPVRCEALTARRRSERALAQGTDPVPLQVPDLDAKAPILALKFIDHAASVGPHDRVAFAGKPRQRTHIPLTQRVCAVRHLGSARRLPRMLCLIA